jgi:glucose/arabinose dehydrogenase
MSVWSGKLNRSESLLTSSPRCGTGARRSLRPVESLESRLLLASVPDGFTDTQVIGDLDSPTAMEIAPDGRIFLADQKGFIYLVQDGQKTLLKTLPQVDFQVERGLLGITIDPNFSTNHLVYAYYTTTAGGVLHNRISRFPVNGNTAGAEQVLRDLPDISGATNHLGGALHFGGDGKLYVGSGDHTQGIVAQQLDSVFGKLLRFNADGSIPTDNPFYNQASGVNKAIWARGLRNPFTFGVQPGTGIIFIDDVGDETYEEIDRGIAGANYGWPTSEGPNNVSGFTAPVHYYDRRNGFGCAISGGTFYNPTVGNFPAAYTGEYFFVDLCGGWMDVYNPATDQATRFANGLPGPVDLDVGPDGSLYYLARGGELGQGRISKIRFAQVGAPNVTSNPRSQSVSRGGSATFSVTASGSGSLEFQWQFNGQDIPGANAASFTVANAQPDDAGQYRAIVNNDLGTAASAAATLTVVTPVGHAPVATIISPTAGTKFRYGQTFAFSGTGTDAEDGVLGPSRFTWRVDYHTGAVTRPFVPTTTGKRSGTFTIPAATPFKETNVFYRITLTVRDRDGRSTTVTRDLTPFVANLSLASNLSGVTLELDGTPHATPFNVNNVVGLQRFLKAPAALLLGGKSYVFDGWSDGGDALHQISAPAANTTYTARYRRVSSLTTSGLAQTIYNNRNRSGAAVTSNVANINFDWGNRPPAPGIAPDTYFVRWQGYVRPQFTERYTFHADANDGVRVYVNNQLLIDRFENSSGESSGSIDLVKSRRYTIQVDYFENTGTAHAKLFWSSDSVSKQIIPRNRLSAPVVPTNRFAAADAFTQGGGASGDNFGTRGSLLTRNAAGESKDLESFLKFNLTTLGSSISSAKLRLFGQLSGAAQTNVLTALYASSDTTWGERTITFDNRPAASGKAIASATISNTAGQWYEFDVTDFLRDAKDNGETLVTFVLKNPDNSAVNAVFNSREAAANIPELRVWS